MIFKTIKGGVRKTGFVLISSMVIAVSAAYSADSPAKPTKPSSPQAEAKQAPVEWKKVVEAAKREGKIVMSGSPSEEWRKSLVDLFKQDYPEITVEYTGINGRNFVPRVRQERALGQRLWDLLAVGTTTAYDLKNDGFLEPIRPLLLPEIADDSKWIGGVDGLFNDRENKFIPSYIIYIQQTTSVNLDFIKGSEITSSQQLLDQKFKGKIVIQSPTAGSTFTALCNLAFMYGEKFVRDLLSTQNVVVTDDIRQQTEWVVRGKYPITIGFENFQLIPYIKQGLGRNVVKLEDKITPVGTGLGGICLFKDAPHPNAARVYINWLLSQKTQMQLSKNVLLNSRRGDVPPVVKDQAVDPNNLSKYRQYSTEENVEINTRLLPMLKEALKK